MSGQPTKWTKDVNKKIVEFFDIEPTREVEVTIRHKNGSEETRYEERPNPLPTFEKFAANLGVSRDTLHEWQKPDNEAKYPGFSDAYKKAKELQKNILMTNGLLGHYAPAFAIFTAKNITDMRDSHELTVENSPIALIGFNFVPPKLEDSKNIVFEINQTKKYEQTPIREIANQAGSGSEEPTGENK